MLRLSGSGGGDEASGKKNDASVNVTMTYGF